jgi:hypothetical protein
MEIIKTEKEISVQDTKRYNLTIKVGDGQKGSSSFKNYNGQYPTGIISNEFLGTGEVLKTRPIKIASKVTDVNPNTNNVSVFFYLNNELFHEVNEVADEDNGSVFFRTKLIFK